MVDHVVFIPGICGSELYDGDEQIWPGTVWEKVVRSYPDRYVDLLVNSDSLRVGDILDKVSLFGAEIDHFATGYNKALDLLSSIGFNLANNNLTPYPYDWRRDIAVTAQAFHERLLEPDLVGKKVGIVAHSMGGLIARYAMEVLGKHPNVEILVLAAVPHLGATVSYLNLTGARPEIFLTGAQCKRVVNNPKFPAAYQLLPHPATKSFYDHSSGGLRAADLYDANVYMESGLNGASMEIAQATWSKLPLLQLGRDTPCPYFAVAGNSGTTVIAVYLPSAGASSTAIETTAAGDTTVPIWSAAPPSVPSRFVPCDHLGVFEDGQMHKILQGLLAPKPDNPPFFVSMLMENTPSLNALLLPGARGTLPGGRLSVQVGSRSVQADASAHLVVSLVLLDQPCPILQGNLLVSLVTEEGTKPRNPLPISYQGAPVDKIDILITADKPGLLVIDFEGPAWPSDSTRKATVLVLPPSMVSAPAAP